MEKLWTIGEVARYLGVSEADIESLVRTGRLTGYRLGGEFVRFRPEQVKLLKEQVQPRAPNAAEASVSGEHWRDRLRDFLYFYDFYLVAFVLCAALLVYLIWST
ncbi:MAG: helix-turn-helix domain-containing protein [Candidatus Omnitrophica bacterium]|nr:helix-turn-helix domain-containing protein [Candidatus Omnitrophota bacterium]